MRAYISCPLEAALAAKNFGFRYSHPWFDNDVLVPHLFFDWISEEYRAYLYKEDGISTASENKFFLHDESLPLLEPKWCDLIGIHHGLPSARYYHIEDKQQLREAIEAFERKRCRVVERKDLSFPKVQYEES